MNITSEYPLWLLLAGAVLAFIYTFFLYRKDKRLNQLNKYLLWLLSSLRFISVFFIAILLLNPFVKTISRWIEKPVIVFAQDNSASLSLLNDSATNAAYRNNIQNLIATLKDKYDVQLISFGDEVEEGLIFKTDKKQTDISAVFREVENRYENTNLGAVIIASDGIYNRGENPVYAVERIKVPVYTIALGDTNVKKDQLLSEVAHNRIAFLGNTFPVEVVVNAYKLNGSNSKLTIYKGNKLLHEQNIRINDNDFTVTIPFQVKAEETGLQRYSVRVSRLEGEHTYVNNSQDIFIDVLDNREKILLLCEAPHPDIAAIRSVIESNENYELTVVPATQFTGSLTSYSLVILHQLPSSANAVNKLLAEANEKKVALWFIAGNATNYSALNTNPCFSITNIKPRFNDVTPVYDNTFSLFTLSETTQKAITYFPPLASPYGTYNEKNSSASLFKQKIGNVNTDYPLWSFSNFNEHKVSLLAGEGMWRWKMHDYLQNGNSEAFTELIQKTIQFLNTPQDRSLFRVNAKPDYMETEEIIMDAELYNASYESVNTDDINIVVRNDENKKYTFAFTRTATAYRLNAGFLPVGHYYYEASTGAGNNLKKSKGEFSVSPVVAEMLNTQADHRLLNVMSAKTGAAMVYPGRINDLDKILLSREDLKPLVYNNSSVNDLISFKWLFFLLLFLLGLEWFIRKYSGAY